tara:strand:+ start:50 stop:559 length:510 start_codon:yes stop_codon:yes gene_type:complete
MITRKPQFYIFIIILCSSFLFPLSTYTADARTLDDLEDLEKGSVSIKLNSNESIEFSVLIAESNKDRRQGLMHIEFMEENQGMLFLFNPPRRVSMWMRNTPMSLDILFINRNGEVINMEENTTPYSTKALSSGGTIRWVLEINGGLAKKMGIKTGDLVLLESTKGPGEE